MVNDSPPARPPALKILVIIEAVFAVAGFMSGAWLLADPSGEAMGLSHLLEDIPFEDFTPVGVFFVICYGFLPAFAAYGLWTRRRWRWIDAVTKWTGHHWAWLASAMIGIILILWIAVEIYYLGILDGVGGILQASMATLGIVILGFIMIPSVRQSTRLDDRKPPAI